MATTYKLIYFNLPGRGEPIRMLFAYGGVDFEDVRIEFEDWPKLKPSTPLGQLPVLEINGKPYTQMIPLSRYVGNIVNLAGKDPLENLAIDSAVEICMDLLKAAYEYSYEKDETRKSTYEEKLNAVLPVLLGKLDADVKKNGYVALNRITWADICFLCSYEDLQNLCAKENLFANYVNLKDLKNKLLKIENLRNYISKRPHGKPTNKYDLKNDL